MNTRNEFFYTEVEAFEYIKDLDLDNGKLRPDKSVGFPIPCTCTINGELENGFIVEVINKVS